MRLKAQTPLGVEQAILEGEFRVSVELSLFNETPRKATKITTDKHVGTVDSGVLPVKTQSFFVKKIFFPCR